METLNVKIKKLSENAVIPTYSQEGDAGMDLVATSESYDEFGNIIYGTGLSFEIPKGYVGLLFPRSSNANKQILLSNSVGVIDSGYRGEVTLKFKPTVRVISFGTLKNIINNFFKKIPKKISIKNYYGNAYKVGDRVGQIIILPYPQIEFEESEELSETKRGSGSYGSTGK